MMKANATTPLWIFGGLLLVLFQVYAQGIVQCPKPEPGAPPVLLPNPRNCSQYFICDGLNPIQMECPFPLVFDPSISGCQSPGLYACEATTEPGTTQTTTPFTTVNTGVTDEPSEYPTDSVSMEPEPVSDGTSTPSV